MQRLWGQTFPANIFPNEKCSRVRVSDRIYMVSVPHYSDFHRQNFNKSCFQRNYMRLMLYFCQFKITLPLCCALSKWKFPPAGLSLSYSKAKILMAETQAGQGKEGGHQSPTGATTYGSVVVGSFFQRGPKMLLRLNSITVSHHSNLSSGNPGDVAFPLGRESQALGSADPATDCIWCGTCITKLYLVRDMSLSFHHAQSCLLSVLFKDGAAMASVSAPPCCVPCDGSPVTLHVQPANVPKVLIALVLVGWMGESFNILSPLKPRSFFLISIPVWCCSSGRQMHRGSLIPILTALLSNASTCSVDSVTARVQPYFTVCP